eukprot:Skav208527  [mRNA]  locus=scaffold6929:17853:20881:- [translate_table: standard]
MLGLCNTRQQAKILRKFQSGHSMIKHLTANLVKEEDAEKTKGSSASKDFTSGSCSQAEPVGESEESTETPAPETDIIDPEFQKQLERECDMMDFVTTEYKDMFKNLRLLLAFSAASEETTHGAESEDVSAKKHDLHASQSTSCQEKSGFKQHEKQQIEKADTSIQEEQNDKQQVQRVQQAEADTTLPSTQAKGLNKEQGSQPEQELPVPVPPSPPSPSPGSPLRLGLGEPVAPPLFPAPTTPLHSGTTTGVPPTPPSPDEVPTLSLPPPPEVEEPSPAKDSAPDTRTLYEILGIPQNATSLELRKAYLTRSKQVHPDKHSGAPGSTAEFQKLSNAYNVLSTPHKRFEYDLSIAPGATRAAPPPMPKARGKAKGKAKSKPKASPKRKFSPKKASPKPKATPKGTAKRKAAKAKASPKKATTPQAKKSSKRKAASVSPKVDFYAARAEAKAAFFGKK